MNRRRHKTATLDCVEEESRKRVFWCAYSLDNYLSSALGRPKIFHDDDIDQVRHGNYICINVLAF